MRVLIEEAARASELLAMQMINGVFYHTASYWPWDIEKKHHQRFSFVDAPQHDLVDLFYVEMHLAGLDEVLHQKGMSFRDWLKTQLREPAENDIYGPREQASRLAINMLMLMPQAALAYFDQEILQLLEPYLTTTSDPHNRFFNTMTSSPHLKNKMLSEIAHTLRLFPIESQPNYMDKLSEFESRHLSVRDVMRLFFQSPTAVLMRQIRFLPKWRVHQWMDWRFKKQTGPEAERNFVGSIVDLKGLTVAGTQKRVLMVFLGKHGRREQSNYLSLDGVQEGFHYTGKTNVASLEFPSLRFKSLNFEDAPVLVDPDMTRSSKTEYDSMGRSRFKIDVDECVSVCQGRTITFAYRVLGGYQKIKGNVKSIKRDPEDKDVLIVKFKGRELVPFRVSTLPQLEPRHGETVGAWAPVVEEDKVMKSSVDEDKISLLQQAPLHEDQAMMVRPVIRERIAEAVPVLYAGNPNEFTDKGETDHKVGRVVEDADNNKYVAKHREVNFLPIVVNSVLRARFHYLMALAVGFEGSNAVQWVVDSKDPTTFWVLEPFYGEKLDVDDVNVKKLLTFLSSKDAADVVDDLKMWGAFLPRGDVFRMYANFVDDSFNERNIRFDPKEGLRWIDYNLAFESIKEYRDVQEYLRKLKTHWAYYVEHAWDVVNNIADFTDEEVAYVFDSMFQEVGEVGPFSEKASQMLEDFQWHSVSDLRMSIIRTERIRRDMIRQFRDWVLENHADAISQGDVVMTVDDDNVVRDGDTMHQHVLFGDEPHVFEIDSPQGKAYVKVDDDLLVGLDVSQYDKKARSLGDFVDSVPGLAHRMNSHAWVYLDVKHSKRGDENLVFQWRARLLGNNNTIKITLRDDASIDLNDKLETKRQLAFQTLSIETALAPLHELIKELERDVDGYAIAISEEMQDENSDKVDGLIALHERFNVLFRHLQPFVEQSEEFTTQTVYLKIQAMMKLFNLDGAYKSLLLRGNYDVYIEGQPERIMRHVLLHVIHQLKRVVGMVHQDIHDSETIGNWQAVLTDPRVAQMEGMSHYLRVLRDVLAYDNGRFQRFLIHDRTLTREAKETIMLKVMVAAKQGNSIEDIVEQIDRWVQDFRRSEAIYGLGISTGWESEVHVGARREGDWAKVLEPDVIQNEWYRHILFDQQLFPVEAVEYIAQEVLGMHLDMHLSKKDLVEYVGRPALSWEVQREKKNVMIELGFLPKRDNQNRRVFHDLQFNGAVSQSLLDPIQQDYRIVREQEKRNILLGNNNFTRQKKLSTHYPTIGFSPVESEYVDFVTVLLFVSKQRMGEMRAGVHSSLALHNAIDVQLPQSTPYVALNQREVFRQQHSWGDVSAFPYGDWQQKERWQNHMHRLMVYYLKRKHNQYGRASEADRVFIDKVADLFEEFMRGLDETLRRHGTSRYGLDLQYLSNTHGYKVEDEKIAMFKEILSWREFALEGDVRVLAERTMEAAEKLMQEEYEQRGGDEKFLADDAAMVVEADDHDFVEFEAWAEGYMQNWYRKNLQSGDEITPEVVRRMADDLFVELIDPNPNNVDGRRRIEELKAWRQSPRSEVRENVQRRFLLLLVSKRIDNFQGRRGFLKAGGVLAVEQFIKKLASVRLDDAQKGLEQEVRMVRFKYYPDGGFTGIVDPGVMLEEGALDKLVERASRLDDIPLSNDNLWMRESDPRESAAPTRSDVVKEQEQKQGVAPWARAILDQVDKESGDIDETLRLLDEGNHHLGMYLFEIIKVCNPKSDYVKAVLRARFSELAEAIRSGKVSIQAFLEMLEELKPFHEDGYPDFDFMPEKYGPRDRIRKKDAAAEEVYKLAFTAERGGRITELGLLEAWWMHYLKAINPKLKTPLLLGLTPYRDKKFILRAKMLGDVYKDNLKELLSDFSISERLAFLIEFAREVHLLHEYGLLHGDILLRNVLIRRLDKRMMLIDFETMLVQGEKGLFGEYYNSNMTVKHEMKDFLKITVLSLFPSFPSNQNQELSQELVVFLDAINTRGSVEGITTMAGLGDELERLKEIQDAAMTVEGEHDFVEFEAWAEEYMQAWYPKNLKSGVAITPDVVRRMVDDLFVELIDPNPNNVDGRRRIEELKAWRQSPRSEARENIQRRFLLLVLYRRVDVFEKRRLIIKETVLLPAAGMLQDLGLVQLEGPEMEVEEEVRRINKKYYPGLGMIMLGNPQDSFPENFFDHMVNHIRPAMEAAGKEIANQVLDLSEEMLPSGNADVKADVKVGGEGTGESEGIENPDPFSDTERLDRLMEKHRVLVEREQDRGDLKDSNGDGQEGDALHWQLPEVMQANLEQLQEFLLPMLERARQITHNDALSFEDLIESEEADVAHLRSMVRTLLRIHDALRQQDQLNVLRELKHVFRRRFMSNVPQSPKEPYFFDLIMNYNLDPKIFVGDRVSDVYEDSWAWAMFESVRGGVDSLNNLKEGLMRVGRDVYDNEMDQSVNHYWSAAFQEVILEAIYLARATSLEEEQLKDSILQEAESLPSPHAVSMARWMREHPVKITRRRSVREYRVVERYIQERLNGAGGPVAHYEDAVDENKIPLLQQVQSHEDHAMTARERLKQSWPEYPEYEAQVLSSNYSPGDRLNALNVIGNKLEFNPEYPRQAFYDLVQKAIFPLAPGQTIAQEEENLRIRFVEIVIELTPHEADDVASMKAFLIQYLKDNPPKHFFFDGMFNMIFVKGHDGDHVDAMFFSQEQRESLLKIWLFSEDLHLLANTTVAMNLFMDETYSESKPNNVWSFREFYDRDAELRERLRVLDEKGFTYKLKDRVDPTGSDEEYALTQQQLEKMMQVLIKKHRAGEQMEASQLEKMLERMSQYYQKQPTPEPVDYMKRLLGEGGARVLMIADTIENEPFSESLTNTIVALKSSGVTHIALFLPQSLRDLFDKFVLGKVSLEVLSGGLVPYYMEFLRRSAINTRNEVIALKEFYLRMHREGFKFIFYGDHHLKDDFRVMEKASNAIKGVLDEDPQVNKIVAIHRDARFFTREKLARPNSLHLSLAYQLRQEYLSQSKLVQTIFYRNVASTDDEDALAAFVRRYGIKQSFATPMGGGFAEVEFKPQAIGGENPKLLVQFDHLVVDVRHDGGDGVVRGEPNPSGSVRAWRGSANKLNPLLVGSDGAMAVKQEGGIAFRGLDVQADGAAMAFHIDAAQIAHMKEHMIGLEPRIVSIEKIDDLAAFMAG